MSGKVYNGGALDETSPEPTAQKMARQRKPRAPAKPRKPKLTKEEREANILQEELFREQKYHCDFEAYIVVSADTSVVEDATSGSRKRKRQVTINWLKNKAPPDEWVRKMHRNVVRSAVNTRGGVQGSIDWHLLRGERQRATSSTVGRILNMSDEHLVAARRISQSTGVMLEGAGLVLKFQGNALTEHGKNMEPFARRVYMQEHARQPVVEVGFVVHPTLDLFGASPDGICIESGRLVEFKCPKKRYFQVGDAAPLGYWHQCQLQLEVLDCEHLDYFECRHTRRPKGLRTNCVYIRRDRHWFESVKPVIEQFAEQTKRFDALKALFPAHMFDFDDVAASSNAPRKKPATLDATSGTIPGMFRAVVLGD